MPLSNYPNGFASGLSVRGLPILNAYTGQVFWVSSVVGSDGNKGTRERPFATIDYAIGKCTADKGDVILVMPGHTETITAADAINLDVAGVTILGLGVGTKMAEIEFNHANATVGVSADNCSLINLRFNSSITSVTVGVNVKADVDYTLIKDNVFDVDAGGTDEFLHSIRLVDGNVGTVIEGNRIDMGIAGAAVGIHMDADTAFTVIRNNVIRGDYSTACIAGDTTLSTNLLIRSNVMVNGVGGDLNSEPGIELLTGTTGVIADNYIGCNLATKAASVVADTCLLFENYYNEDVSGAATGGIIGAASADD